MVPKCAAVSAADPRKRRSEHRYSSSERDSRGGAWSMDSERRLALTLALRLVADLLLGGSAGCTGWALVRGLVSGAPLPSRGNCGWVRGSLRGVSAAGRGGCRPGCTGLNGRFRSPKNCEILSSEL